MKEFIKRIVPKWAIKFYHWLLANLGALIYGYPSKKLIVIGVTGTKGKSTTSYLIAKFLEDAGYKVGLTSTIVFKIGEKEWLNDKKMTMLGRFGLQKLLREMVNEKCKYAIIETSSEGIAQYRHKGIDYDIAVFTNLSPEHIEAHGSYNKYRAAKGKLFEALSYGKDKGIPKTAIINLDDEESRYFLKLFNNNVGFTLRGAFKEKLKDIISVKTIRIKEDGVEFSVKGIDFRTGLLGKINLYNLTAAISVCKALEIPLKKLKAPISRIDSVPGRMEFIEAAPLDGEAKQDFQVIVDYAHEPASMKALYSIVREIPHKRIIHIFGATGGGRDKARRPVLGEIADQNAQIIILTNDDPYNEDEGKIIQNIKKGIKKKKIDESLFIELDRAKAIEKGIELAKKNDIVLITGKGSEQKMAIRGKMIPWDDRSIARQAIQTLNSKP